MQPKFSTIASKNIWHVGKLANIFTIIISFAWEKILQEKIF
jgi:hypothetical protein